MNNKEFKQINENWDKFLNEEGEQIDEAIISASAALGFIYLFLSNRANAMILLDSLLTRPEIPDKQKEILVTLKSFLVSVENDEDMKWLRRLADVSAKIHPKQWVIDGVIKKIANTLSVGTPAEEPKEIEMDPETEEPSGEE